MMYGNRLAVAVKNNGKVLREFKDTVYLPYGCEYSLLIKNLNTVRTMVNITIDGQNVAPGGLVVNANSEIDLERFVKDLSVGNKFKFIERTKSIEQHKGIGVEDGLIRIEYQYEKVVSVQDVIHHWHGPTHIHHWHDNYGYTGKSNSDRPIGSALRSSSSGQSMGPLEASAQMTQSSLSAASAINYMNDAGITVPGSTSTQKFVTVKDFPLETEKHVMILKLLGETENNKIISKPVTVKNKPKCVTCGHTNRHNAKFCAECGAALEIFA
jgi:hypothetical protein